MNNNIIERLERIETKLDNVIKALHDYDGDEDLHCEYSGLLSVKAYDEPEKMDEDEFDDYGQRVIGDKNNDNTQDKHVGEDKGKRRGGKKNKYYRQPNTPVTPKKMGNAVVQHQQFRQPHKH